MQCLEGVYLINTVYLIILITQLNLQNYKIILELVEIKI